MDPDRSPPAFRAGGQVGGRVARLVGDTQQLGHRTLHLGHQVGQEGLLKGSPVPLEHGHEQVRDPVDSLWQGVQKSETARQGGAGEGVDNLEFKYMIIK